MGSPQGSTLPQVPLITLKIDAVARLNLDTVTGTAEALGGGMATGRQLERATDGLRVDGKANSGKLSGGVRDDIVVSQKSRACPTCLGMVSKYASKCQYCGERLEITSN